MIKFLALCACVGLGVWAVYQMVQLKKDLKARKAKKSEQEKDNEETK